MMGYPFTRVSDTIVDHMKARMDAAKAAAEHGVCEFCGSTDLYADTSTDHVVGMVGRGDTCYTYHPIVCRECQKGQTWWPEGVQNPP